MPELQPFQPTYVSAVQQMRAYRILRARVHEVLDAYRLNGSQWGILGSLYSSPSGVRQVDIATLLDVKASLITILISGLEERGLVVRSGSTLDKRAKLLVLSPKGRQLVETVEQALAEQGDTLFPGITAQDMTSYHKVLLAIIASQRAVEPGSTLSEPDL